MGEMTVTSNPSNAPKHPGSEPSSRVVAIQLLINLKEDPIATDDGPLLTPPPSKFPAQSIFTNCIFIFSCAALSNRIFL